jgi:hypothetical protein
MTTALRSVNAVKANLSGTIADDTSTLLSAYAPGDGYIDLTYPKPKLPLNTIVSCGLNTFLVVATGSDGARLTVLPSYDGGPDVAVPVGAPVFLRPRVTNWRVFSSICDEIKALHSPTLGLFRVQTDTFQTNVPWQTYEPDPLIVQSGIVRVLYVRWRSFGSEERWNHVSQWEFQPSAETGPVVKVNAPIPAGTDVEIGFETGFGIPTALEDDLIADCGLYDSMLDIPELGATASLLMSGEARRQNPAATGDPRRADELPPTSSSSIAREFNRMKKERVQEEAAKMRSLYPYRIPLLTGA